MDEVVVYGSSWCGFTVLLVRELQHMGVPFRYVEVDDDPEAERKIASWNNGRSIRPTVQLGERVWINPSAGVVRAAYSEAQTQAAAGVGQP
jgi:mycoredoxin